MEKLFGTDGIRGHAGEFPLDRQTVAIIGRSLARKYREILGRPPLASTVHDGVVDPPGAWYGERLVQLAMRCDLTAYDAVYVALAEALDASLVTCDRPLGAAPGVAARVEVIR